MFPKRSAPTAVGTVGSRVSPRLSLLLLSASTFLFWASLYVYVPTLPVYAVEGLHAAPAVVGAIISSYAIAQLLLRVPIGMGADTWGRKRFVLLGLLACVAGAAIMAVAPSPWVLFFGRAITGIGAAVWVAFTVYFASSYQGGLAKAMGLVTAINGVALIAASLVGGWVAEEFGWVAAFWLGVGLAVAGFVVALPVPERRGVQSATPFSLATLGPVLRTPLLIVASFIAVLTQFVAYATSFTFVPVVGAALGASKADLGVIITVMFAASTVASLAAVRLANMWGYRVTMAVAAVVLVAATVAVPFVDSVSLLIATQVANGLSRGVTQVLLMALAVRNVNADQRATAMGVYQAVYAIGMLSGPFVCGLVAGWFSTDAVFWLCTAVAVAAAAWSLVSRTLPARAE